LGVRWVLSPPSPAAGILGDKLSYLPGAGPEPLYERRGDLRPFGSRLGGGEIRQVLGTPPAGRHRWEGGGSRLPPAPLPRSDSRQESRELEGVGARLAGQPFLSSPPDLHSRRGARGAVDPQELEDSDQHSDLFNSRATQVWPQAPCIYLGRAQA
jgi:hypothetical protein